jgi:hypothetical protein
VSHAEGENETNHAAELKSCERRTFVFSMNFVLVRRPRLRCGFTHHKQKTPRDHKPDLHPGPVNLEPWTLSAQRPIMDAIHTAEETTFTLSYDDGVVYEDQFPTHPANDAARSSLADRIGTAKIYLLSETTSARAGKVRMAELNSSNLPEPFS